MNPESLMRIFGTDRLKMVTGRYTEVYREAASPGERRRYTKRFLATDQGDFSQWTEREWRTLARLVGHDTRHVPDVVQYDRGAADRHALVQTYDAGVTVDHWTTLIPVQRDGRSQRHVFQDCAHWWALARGLLIALHEIHPLQLVHLDLKADNICIPVAPVDFDPAVEGQRLFLAFEHIALIDFAFSVVSGEPLACALPIGWQRAYRYQSPRLLQALSAGQKGDLEPTRQLDWRCDMYSLAALLEALLPSPVELRGVARNRGWSDRLALEAHALLLRVRQSHDLERTQQLPHLALAQACSAQLDTPELSQSLQRGWTLSNTGANDTSIATAGWRPTAPLTAVTLIETLPVHTAVTEVQPEPDERGVADSPVAVVPFEVSTSPTEGLGIEGTDRIVTTTAPAAPVKSSVPAIDLPPARTAIEAQSATRRVAPYAIVFALAAVSTGWWWMQAPAPPTGGAHAVDRPATVSPVGEVRTEAKEPVASAGTTIDTSRGVPTAVAVSPPVESPGRATGAVDSTLSVTTPHRPSAAPAPTPARSIPTTMRLAKVVPLVVASAEPRVAQALSMAAHAQNASDDRRTVSATTSIGEGAFDQVGLDALSSAPVLGRQLNAAARRAFNENRDVVRAYDLQTRAFDAQPLDAEIAGNLAFYSLKMNPPRAEESRVMAIYALALATRNRGPSRSEDWGSLAVASALTGRSAEARSAMLVLLSVSPDVNRSCHSALSSIASHGEQMRMPAEALLGRARSRVDVSRLPECMQDPARIKTASQSRPGR